MFMNKYFVVFLLLFLLISFPNAYGSIFQNLVDVKGNDAIRKIRILYDINESHTSESEVLHFINKSQDQHSFHHKLLLSQKSNNRQFHLFRGRPLYAEIDFVPRYIPSETVFVAISVELPAHIRGRKWILGWHREQFNLPECRLCTNHAQSYTLPVTLFLPDDGWCPEGRVPTIWKIEALPISAGMSSSSSSLSFSDFNTRTSRLMNVGDQTDSILALAYDEKRQIKIVNHANSSMNCRGISETIVA